ncbi:alpha/beta fold hydrolase [Mycolicibacterium helvum]|uniref:Alpha/beta hydrolase n=1 Tax=Mycolicibacterium helvum TaxID=1534349 RepID=A0A7I7SZJ9_9MYCO|nr:alpha/beta hydrolase [Mycolicibacterium helvum]BBY62457.1 alpha/beta hydrolase [Mycolicibacterium helvum]
MTLFVREYGPADGPTIIFLHGGLMSGWTWEPVVERMQQYRCLVPDLPQYGKSFHQGPFDMGRAANAVAEIIRTRASTGRAHVVGFSLGAQVGVQLLATEPQLVDRAVLSSTVINTLPAVQLTRRLARRLAQTAWFRWTVIDRFWDERQAADNVDYHDDARLNAGDQLADIAGASAGFTLPRGLGKSQVPTLFVAGSDELRLVRRSAAKLAQSMPNGVERVATGMGHDWPLRSPDLFCRTVAAWVCRAPLPPELVLPASGGRGLSKAKLRQRRSV